METHKRFIHQHLAANTLSAQRSIEREGDCQYSVLLELSYFDPIGMCIIDLMHNLLLGIDKHMLSVWTDLSILFPVHFMEIQAKVYTFSTPGYIGRTLTKIGSGFSDLQWTSGVTGQ